MSVLALVVTVGLAALAWLAWATASGVKTLRAMGRRSTTLEDDE